MARSKQLEMSFLIWGGRRRGAGRPVGPRPRVPHRARPGHRAAHPLHVTMRSTFRPLRSVFVFPTIQLAIAGANNRYVDQFRVVHFSVQADHMHLIVEAVDKPAVSRGMRGLAIRLAKNINRLVCRTGSVWADRWHARELTTPRAVRTALAYVFGNFRKHQPNLNLAVDPFSSAPHFPWFLELNGDAPPGSSPESLSRAPPEPRTWLLRVGWLRQGRLSMFEGPARRRR